MAPKKTPPRLTPTRAGKVAAVFVCTVAAILTSLALRHSSESDPIGNLTYPGSTALGYLTNSGTRTAIFTTADNLTNVSGWYSDQLRIGRTGN